MSQLLPCCKQSSQLSLKIRLNGRGSKKPFRGLVDRTTRKTYGTGQFQCNLLSIHTYLWYLRALVWWAFVGGLMFALFVCARALCTRRHVGRRGNRGCARSTQQVSLSSHFFFIHVTQRFLHGSRYGYRRHWKSRSHRSVLSSKLVDGSRSTLCRRTFLSLHRLINWRRCGGFAICVVSVSL